MADSPDDDFDAELDADTAFHLASKVLEMCDRVATAHNFAPGAVAQFSIELDGRRFQLTARVQEAADE